tara:strand:+ start:3145 stop:4341 length:1197 start_codon:yes stop_codon:yes gene_type:complete
MPVSSYIYFEYLFHNKRKSQLEIQKRVPKMKKMDGRFNKIENDIITAKGKEKEDLIKIAQETFGLERNDDGMVLQRLSAYIKDYVINDIDTRISKSTQLMLPFTLQCFFTIVNKFTLIKLRYRYNLEEYNDICKIYHLSSKTKKQHRGVFICFCGLSGLLINLSHIINIIIEAGYDVIIPVYGPAQVSFDHHLNHNEYDYYNCIIRYLRNRHINEVNIVAWSLGGIKYIGFHSILQKQERAHSRLDIQNKIVYNPKIEAVYLLEPLLSLRAVIDKILLHKRNWTSTFHLMNYQTPDLTLKYKIYNGIMAYFFHTILAHGVANSTDLLRHMEYKTPNTQYTYPRYLFVSKSDFILNDISDNDLISNQFKKENVFYRKGYHGGWMKSRYLNRTFGNLVRS